MSDKPVIGFIGLGAIGHPMASRIGEAGYELVVHDISAEALQRFAGKAHLAASAKDVADRADIVFLCLATLPAHHAVVFGPEGAGAGSRMRILVVTSTTGPGLIGELEQALAPRVAVVDAPMTGGRVRAANGTLTVMMAGPAAAVAEVEPVLRAYAGRVAQFGEVAGRAQTMKLINNIMSAVNFAVACEALVLGAKAGLHPEAMLEVINNGTGQNDASVTMIPRNVLTRDFAFGSNLAVILKDMSAAIAVADELGAPVTLTRTVKAMFADTIAAGFAETEDQTVLVKALERLAGTEIERTR